ncbi:transport and Golgi organization protein 1 homolog isoform X4 [Leucoraja erinacea]|uniref:transport and Golgi organization protein 1 homolog isoform X4 n=1 Tax=Leucoraja erinaceus TaxID=7782 RepID=UPI00245456BD|nr:transport and Golgi organization protein 1 homolog isoform X4 [Leucoraja erinacea]
MAAVMGRLCLWALLVAAATVTASSGHKLFSDFKRCLDEECSLLMCRGKAVRNFVGPDCRFLKFKTGETIYVYYKLAGKRNDLWAGSVGSQFGYFPKELIDLNLVYSTTEVELPAEDTDFGCFGEGGEEFDDVDLDELVRAAGSSEDESREHVVERGTGPREKREDDTGQGAPDDELGKTSTEPGDKSGDDQASEEEDAVQSAEEEVSDSQTQAESREVEAVDSALNNEQSLHVEDEESAEKPADVGDNISSLEDHSTREDGSSHVKVGTRLESNSQDPESSPPTEEGREGLHRGNGDIRGSAGLWGRLAENQLESQEGELEAFHELEGSSVLVTGFGSTDDAVVVDDEVTSKVTALDEDPEFDAELETGDLAESLERIPLLSYLDTKSLPEQGGVKDEDAVEDHHLKSSEGNTETITQTLDTPEASISTEKGQWLDGVTQEITKNEEILTSEDTKSGGLRTTLGDTMSAVVSGDEITSKVIDLDNSEDLPEDTRDVSRQAYEEEDKIYLLSMSEEEAENKLLRSTDEAVGTEADVEEGSPESEAAVQALDTSSEWETNHDTEEEEEEEEGAELEPLDASNVEGQESGQYQEGNLQTESATPRKMVVDDEFKNVPEVGESNQEIELQSDAEVKSGTEMNQYHPEFNQSEPETGVDKSSESSEHASFERPGTVIEGLKSKDETKVVTREGFPAEDINTTLSQGEVKAEDGKSSWMSGTDLDDRKMLKLEDDVGEKDPREIKLPSDGSVDLAANSISEQVQEEVDDVDSLYEPYVEVQPDQLLEDENAADARMAREHDANANREDGLDDQELDIDDMIVTEESNIVEPEVLQDGGEEAAKGFKDSTVEEDHEVEKEGAQNIYKQADQIESQKESEQPSLRPLDKDGLSTEEEGRSQDLKQLSGELHEESSESDEGIQTEESAEGGDRGPEAYPKSENTSNPSKVEGNKTEELTLTSNDIGIQDTSKMFAGLKYQQAVEKLIILKGSLGEKSLELVLKYLSHQQVLEVEAALQDLEEALKLAKLSTTDKHIENTLDDILEKAESNILDMVDNMLDKRAEMNQLKTEEKDPENDDETMILNDLQEALFQLRIKYSPIKESVALAPGEDLSQERIHPHHDSLDQGKQGAPDGEEKEEEEEVEEKEEEQNDQLEKSLHSPLVTKNVSHSGGKQEPSAVEGSQGNVDSTEAAASQKREEVKETARETSSPEKDREKELPSVSSPEGGIGRAQEEAVADPATPRVTQRHTWGGAEQVEAPPLNITKRMEEAGRESSPEGGAGHDEIGQSKGREHARGTGSPMVGEGAQEEEVVRGGSVLKAEDEETSLGKSEGMDVGGDSVPREEQQEMGDVGEATTEGVAEKARLEEARGSPASQEKSQWLPWVISALEGVIMATSNTLGPIAHSLSESLMSSLTEEMRLGPDFHGVPWEPILITAALGILTFFIFIWRTCLSVKSRIYQISEKQIAEKVKQLIQEKTEVLEKLSTYEKKLEEAKILMDEAQNVKSTTSVETKELEESRRELEQVNLHLETRVKNLQASLEKEKEENTKQQTMIVDTQKSVKKLQKVNSAHLTDLSQVQGALSATKANEEKLQTDLQSMIEKNTRLKQSKSQLLKEAEGWSERHSELNEQIKLCQKAQRDLEETLAYKDNEIEVLSDCVMQLRQLDTECDDEDNGWDKEVDGEVANGELPDKNKKTKMKIQQMMDVSRVKTTLKIIEEEKDHFQAKLTDEIKARRELEEQIKQLEHNSAANATEKSKLENEFKTMQQKLEILTELYHQKEMALQKKLTQEECQRQEKELKLTVADDKALQAHKDVKMYKQRIQEMEEELQKTERSFKNQVAAHEKKAHENWLSARSAERTLTEEKRETANLRQKLIELNQKLSLVQRPSIIKPTAGRPDRQGPPGAPPPLGPARRAPVSRDDSYGPSPVSTGPPSPPVMLDLLVRPPSVNASRGFPWDRGDGGHRVPPPSREWIGPGTDRLGPSSDQGSPPPQWDRRPGPMDGYPGPQRPSSELAVMSGRISGPSEIRGLVPANRAAEMGPGGPGQLPSGPRTSSPNTTESMAVNANAPQLVPSFPGAPVMNSPLGGMPLAGPRHGFPPPRGPYGPVPHMQNHLVRVPALRDYPPFPPPGHRPFLPGPLPPPPHVLRDFPPGAREYPRGPRGLPLGPTPPPGAHEYPPHP